MLESWFAALRRGTPEQVRTLLDARPELALAVEPEGMPAIFVAVMRDDPNIVALLLERGASASAGFLGPAITLAWTDLPAHDRPAPLDHPIAFARSLPVLRALLDAGADARHARVATLARTGVEALSLLFERGVEPDARAFDEAPLESLALLVAHARPETLEEALRWACEQDRREAVEILLAYEPTRASMLASGRALAGAAAFDHVALVRRLLELGADPDAVLPDRSTPLIEAAFEGAEAAALVLLDAGARGDRTNGFGQTALVGALACGAERLAARLAGERAAG